MKVTVTRRQKKGFFDKAMDFFKRPKPVVEVGFPEGEVDGEVRERAIYNEFGTRTIPERPFMRNALRQNGDKYQALIKRASPKILRGETTPEAELRKIGIVAQGDVQHEIEVLDTPPNAPSTIARKGSSNPLIETGVMRQAVTYKVSKRK